jgi:hypothetical protein
MDPSRAPVPPGASTAPRGREGPDRSSDEDSKLLETDELADRLAVLEAAVRAGGAALEPVFPEGEP